MKKPRLSLIAAVAENNAIGKDNKLLWHLPKDFQFFKKNTQNKTIVMGKNTWLSLPLKPLPQRRNIILSTSLKIEQNNTLQCVKSHTGISWDDKEENMIIGGASLYQHYLPLCDKLYLTHVQATFTADTFFPQVDFTQWDIVNEEKHLIDAAHKFNFCCTIYQRKQR